jgi:hypothetical protein
MQVEGGEEDFCAGGQPVIAGRPQRLLLLL